MTQSNNLKKRTSDLDELMARNSQFAQQYEGGLSIKPRLSTMILTCIDARTDPAHLMGLELGDALVFRTAGARVSRDLERDLGILWTMLRTTLGDQFKGLELAIIQHNDCGYERLTNPNVREALHHNLGIDKDEIDALANVDHSRSIYEDIERLRGSSLVPDELVVSGHVYHLEDGTVRQVVAPAPLASNYQ